MNLITQLKLGSALLLTVVCLIAVADPSELDQIEASQLGVKYKSSPTFYLDATTQMVINSLGTPLTSINEYWEVTDQTALIYNYNNAKFNFVDNKLDSYELTNSAFLVGNDSIGRFFNVGSPLSNVSGYLPNWSSKKNDGTLTGNITVGGRLTDKFIYIEFDPSNEIITSISIRSY